MNKFILFFKSFLLLDILYGMFLTFKYIFKPRVTVNYPFEKTKISFKFKGEHALRRYENGEERCISCKLCEVICPAQVITIEGDKREDGSRRTQRYDLDLSKCIFCGLCEDACPTDAIVLTNNVEYATHNSKELLYNKDKLLDNGAKYENYLREKLNYLAPYR
jgi:NADH-quinone oxidoreductase subunit I